MFAPLPLALLVVVGLLVLLVRAAGPKVSRAPAPVYAARPLLTANELEFYKRLRHALPEYHVLPQVSLAALMEPVTTDPSSRRAALNRIAQKRVDYVIAERGDLHVLALVELDDRTHRASRDADRDSLTASAGYVTHRFSSTRKPTAPAIREQVLGLPMAEIVPFPGAVDQEP